MRTLILSIGIKESQLLELNQAAIDITGNPDNIDMYFFDQGNDHAFLDKLSMNKINLVKIKKLPSREVEGYKAYIRSLQISEYDVILLGSNIISNQLAAYISVANKRSFLNGITRVISANPLTVEKDIYSNNLVGEFEIKGKAVLSIANEVYKKIENGDGNPLIEKSTVDVSPKVDWILDSSYEEKVAEVSLENSEFLIVIGRGIGDKENFEKLASFVGKTDFSLGVTRPVFSNGWASRAKLVGASGIVTAAKVTVVIGASGASPFLAGIKNSDLIIAINSDPRAPIFKHADVGIICDYKDIIQELKKHMLSKGLI